MPKNLKDTKVIYWRQGEIAYDNIGITHREPARPIAEVWANVNSQDYKLRLMAGATWDRDVIDVTFTRGLFEVHMNDYVQIGDRYYKVKEINHGEHRKGTDVTLGCQASSYEEMTKRT